MVYVLFAEGFEETEAIVPVDFLRRAQVPVTTVSMMPNTLSVRGSHGITLECDRCASEELEYLQMLILPGGMPGTRNLDMHPFMDGYLRQVTAQDAWLAAICAAPLVLGHRGLLSGRRAICYPGFESELTGAEILRQRVVRDGNLITAIGAGAALEFAHTLAAVLVGKERADSVLAALC